MNNLPELHLKAWRLGVEPAASYHKSTALTTMPPLVGSMGKNIAQWVFKFMEYSWVELRNLRKSYGPISVLYECKLIKCVLILIYSLSWQICHQLSTIIYAVTHLQF